MKTRLLSGLVFVFFIRPVFASNDVFSLALNLSDEPSPQVESMLPEHSKIGLEIGAFIFLGPDFHIFYRPAGSQWMFGYRYLEYTEDFEFYGIETDEETNTISGPFIRYLFEPNQNQSYYLGAAVYEWKQELECKTLEGTDEDSITSIFVGGGYMGGQNQWIGYNLGLLLAPWASLSTEAGGCSSETDGGLDINASIMISF